MRAYVLGQIEVSDPEAFTQYRERVKATIEAHGGRYLVRGGAMTKMEGDWPYPRAVVIEFPSRQAAETWYRSPGYAALIGLRQRASRTNLVIVDGVD